MKKFLLTFAAGALLTAPAFAAGDPVMGKKQFGQCMACHSVDPAKGDMTGPNLAGVVGSKAGKHRPKFAYSPAMKAAKLTWDEATLDKYLQNPSALVPKNKMVFLGIPKKPTRDNIIAYLKTTGK